MSTKYQLPSVFFEMLQSFTALGHTLNLSQAVKLIGVTRQTIRRHVNDLEDIKNEKLFELKDRKYNLTSAGHAAMAEAEVLLRSAATWLSVDSGSFDGLPCLNVRLESGLRFHAQRHRLHRVWEFGLPLMCKGLDSWIRAQQQIEHSDLEAIRPYLVIYRKVRGDWICVEVGGLSSYATWLGSTWAKSAIGLSFSNDPIKSEADRFMVDAYDYAALTGGAWYDHVSTQLRRSEGAEPTPVNYHRLVFSLLFPDGEPAVAALIARTNNISIAGLEPQNIPLMPKEDLMEFDM